MLSLLLISTFTAPRVNVIPTPTKVTVHAGTFELKSSTVITGDGASSELADQLNGFIAPATGFSLKRAKSADTNRILIQQARHDPAIGQEGYRLKVTKHGVTIWANSPAGRFYGLQTLRQLLPTDIFSRERVARSWTVPQVDITDSPRFAWRGLMLDVARHFFPKQEVMRFIDALAMHKMSHLHLHLTDDQGWRIEIKRYPKLTTIGSKRAETMAGRYSDHKFDGVPHGGFYTQADIRQMVAYAAKNHITIMPEIEMPGHAQAALAAYPELGNTNKKLPVKTDWGVNENVFNANDKTIEFVQNVLTEVMQLFPSEFIHVGGDEVPKKQWKESPVAQDLMKQRGLKSEEELQSWFIRQMDGFLTKHGRRLIGWDEILEGGLAPSATVMSWRGTKGGIAAAKAGHDVVMAPTTYCYFDFYQSKHTEKEPLAIGGFLPLETVYGFDPVPTELTHEQAKHILGAQAQLWSEYIATPKHLEYMAFPRVCALADTTWRAEGTSDFKGFRDTLNVHLKRLALMGVNYREPSAASDAGVAHWKSGEVTNDWSVHEWDLSRSFDKAGYYAVTFQYSGGEHRLDVGGIEILGDGAVVATDPHFGRTGGEDVKNVFRVRLLKPYKRVTLRAKVRADGGADSNGDIFVVRER